MWLLTGAALLLLGLLALRTLSTARPESVLRAGRWAAVFLALALMGWLAATGRLHLLWVGLLPLLSWVGRARAVHDLWRLFRRGGGKAQPRGQRMSREEALSILGLGPDATPDDIRAAHRRLMKAAHPDRGGATDRAARLNAARDVLLG